MKFRLMNAQGLLLFNFRGPSGGVRDRRRLKERGVSHNCNKLNKTNMLLAKILREFQKSGISTPSIDTSQGRLEIQIALSNPNIEMSESSLRVIVLPSLVYPYFDIEQGGIRKALLVK